MQTSTLTLPLPLDHADPTGPTIDVFARVVTGPGGEDMPYLVFLQGGPGQESPRPEARPSPQHWLTRALRDYRVVLLDQRGTGNSTPVGGPDSIPGGTAQQKAEYLTHFRADSIVADCEAIRAHLGVPRWSLLGQSFGGFTSIAYLSSHPDSLAEVYITGGLTPVATPVDDIYRTTYDTMAAKSERYYARRPADRDRMRQALDACRDGNVRLPNGDAATPDLLRTVGTQLGRTGGDDALHYLLERDPQSPAFGHDLAALLPFNSGRASLYAVLHESSYADGVATRWSAERIRPAAFAADETLLTGEHIYPWHFQVCSDLAPWREVADVLAEHEWPVLYDAAVLRRCEARVAAIAYADDAFVDLELSQRTADLIPSLRNGGLWITNEWEHNGIGVAGEKVLDRLIDLARD